MTLRKARAIFAIFFQEGLAYRASGFIWIMTDLVTAVTMPLVWATASKAAMGPIAGYNIGDFVLYYLCMLLLSCFITSHIMWELATEIKEGQFTSALIRPVSFFQYTFFRNIAWRIIRPSLFAPVFVILLFAYRGYLQEAHVFMGWQFWVSVLCGHLVSFTFVYTMAMLALFVQEAYSIFELYYVPMLFLSGQLFPVDILPGWAQTIAKAFPFYYTTGFPTEVLVGRVKPDVAVSMIGIQLAWITGLYGLSRLLWSKGLRHYNGVGM